MPAEFPQAGAQYGYALLWSLIPMTIALYVTEEMCARMGVVTGKGLSDLIREEFGFRPTFFVMITGFFVDLANVVAEFAGVAAAMQIFHISKYVAVPIAAILVWILVIQGTYRQVEVIFLFACILYLSYVFSAVLAKPDWLIAARHTVIPNVRLDSGYLLMLTGLIGTTIAPWQFFYLQAGFVEKKVGPRQYPQARAVCFGPAGYHGRRASGPCANPPGREVGRHAVCVWASERFVVCGVDFASIHSSRHL